MNLTIRVLGLDLLSIDLTTDSADETGPGDATAMPIGFVARLDRPDEADIPDRE